MLNVTDFKEGLTNITSSEQLYSYVADKLFVPSVTTIFTIFLLLMLVLGLFIVDRNKGNYYAIFILSILVLGIMLFFTFWFPLIPLVIDKVLSGGF